MPRIKKLMLQNFKKFDSLHLQFHPGKNVLIGDNEAGKSSILMALDLTLNASRSRVESLGLESLLSQRAVNNFFLRERRLLRGYRNWSWMSSLTKGLILI